MSNCISYSRVCGSTKLLYAAHMVHWAIKTASCKLFDLMDGNVAWPGTFQHYSQVSAVGLIGDTHPAGTEKDGGQGCIGGHNVSG